MFFCKYRYLYNQFGVQKIPRCNNDYRRFAHRDDSDAGGEMYGTSPHTRNTPCIVRLASSTF